eukprot:TRINITY_DN446_c0_g1_i1.p1 TRINITY_DN446_c0_g1~~TRINITY_DN446_c0_g1_i1.p1  ORF type:complete len:353 (+),score=116.62 TRINITY_DN446_c0_g1_i1:76-1059(+)
MAAGAAAAAAAPPLYKLVFRHRGQASVAAAVVAACISARLLLARRGGRGSVRRRPSRRLAARDLALTAVALWAVSVRLKDASINDIAWAMLFGIAGRSYYLSSGGDDAEGYWLRRRITLCMLATWGARLSSYLALRNKVDAKWHGEDFRYRAMRKTFDKKLSAVFGGSEHYWWFSLFQVFFFQGALAFVVSEPVRAIMEPAAQPQRLTALDWAGMALWAAGFIFEAGGDWQLTAFQEDASNKGKLLTSGLWSLTRHPNYLGNALMWWGIGLVAQNVAGQRLSAVGPLVMNYLLTNVSGVAMLERSLKRKQGWADYANKTSSFVPKVS